MRKSATLCPECGSPSIVPIIYGKPTKDLVRMEEEGLAIMGGYSSSDQDPEWHCNDCEHEWNETHSDQEASEIEKNSRIPI